MNTLNENELKVLSACKDAIVKETRCEFGRFDFVVVEGMSKNQLKGYISQLQTKGLVSIDESSFHNITMSIKGCNYLLDNTDTDHEVIHEIKSNAAIFD